MHELNEIGYIQIESATIDTDREERCGLPEVVYCEGKRPEQTAEILGLLRENHGIGFGTRCSVETAVLVESLYDEVWFNGQARTIRVGQCRDIHTELKVSIVAAGTSDLAIATESEETLVSFGYPCNVIVDVGVAGVHRLLDRKKELDDSQVLIVVAGMEGALASVICGITNKPVVAVPTSVGYGTAFEGITALLGMLTSCASGVSVVGIDNGFGAAAAAMRIVNAVENSIKSGS